MDLVRVRYLSSKRLKALRILLPSVSFHAGEQTTDMRVGQTFRPLACEPRWSQSACLRPGDGLG